MEYRFYTPKQRLARLEASLREFETKHFVAKMNALNAAATGEAEAERAGLAQLDALDLVYRRTLADYEILAEEIERASSDEVMVEVEK